MFYTISRREIYRRNVTHPYAWIYDVRCEGKFITQGAPTLDYARTQVKFDAKRNNTKAIILETWRAEDYRREQRELREHAARDKRERSVINESNR